MVPNLLFSQLLLIASVLMYFMIYIWWPDDPPATLRTPLKPDTPCHKRSKAPQPVAGPLRNPLCDAWEQPADARPKAPGALPPLIIDTRGRKRRINTQQQCGPDQDCAYFGWLGRGHIRANGHPRGQRWRQLHCVSCHGYFYDTHDTIFHGQRGSPERIVRVLACLAEGVGLRGTARVFEVDPHTVLPWLVEAAEQLHAFSAYFLPDLPLHQVQLDALYAVLRAVKDGEVSVAEAIARLSRSPHGVWTAMDPERKLLLAIDVGERTLAMAQGMVHHVAPVLMSDWAPLFLTDGFRAYMTAVLTHYGPWVHPERRHATGPRPNPRWMPRPTLLYAQGVNTMRQRRLVEVKHRVILGTQAAAEQVLAACGWQINTAFVERLNLSLRQRVAAMRRRSATSCQGEDGLGQQLVLFPVYHHFVLRHTSLRQALAESIPTTGKGSATVWRSRTPAMAAGLTDQVWSLKEVLMFRVPPWPQMV